MTSQCDEITLQRYGGFLAHTIAIMWHSEYQTKGIQSLGNKKGSAEATFYLVDGVLNEKTCQHKSEDSGDMRQGSVNLGLRRAPLVIQ